VPLPISTNERTSSSKVVLLNGTSPEHQDTSPSHPKSRETKQPVTIGDLLSRGRSHVRTSSLHSDSEGSLRSISPASTLRAVSTIRRKVSVGGSSVKSLKSLKNGIVSNTNGDANSSSSSKSKEEMTMEDEKLESLNSGPKTNGFHLNGSTTETSS
jgi:hypothetical protein